METTPDKYNKWEVTVDYLEEALGQIHRHGSTVIAVTPYEIAMATGTVSSYLVIYYNPPIQAPILPGGSGNPATLQ